MPDFELAKDKVLMGAERKSMVISNEEKRVTAYHEAGHTLVGLKVPNVGSGPQSDHHPARNGAWRDASFA